MAIPGEVQIVDDVPAAFARQAIDAFRGRTLDTFSIALSGGQTARRCYERLADDAGSQIDWWKVDVYWGDERCVPHDHEVLPRPRHRHVDAVEREQEFHPSRHFLR